MINSLSITIFGHYRLLEAAAVTTLVTLRHTRFIHNLRVYVCCVCMCVRKRAQSTILNTWGLRVPRTPSPSADPHRFPYARRPVVCNESAHFPLQAQFALRHSCKIGWGCCYYYYYNHHNTNANANSISNSRSRRLLGNKQKQQMRRSICVSVGR